LRSRSAAEKSAKSQNQHPIPRELLGRMSNLTISFDLELPTV
jgi:hypothetical protein